VIWIKLLNGLCSRLDDLSYWIQWRFIIGKKAQEAYRVWQGSRHNFQEMVRCRNILRRRLEYLKVVVGDNAMAFQLLAAPYRQLDRRVKEQRPVGCPFSTQTPKTP